MKKIKLNCEYLKMDFEEKVIEENKKKVSKLHEILHDPSGIYSNYTGWLNMTKNAEKRELEEIKETAEKIKKNTTAFVIIGIGGSYLGSRAVIEALGHTFQNELSREKRKAPKIYYIGQNMSAKYINDLIEILKNEEVSINVISKSGTTIEPALGFRICKEFLEKKYGRKMAKERIYITTDSEKGQLKELAEKEGYKKFIIPSDIGGRFSVLTPVGLLPIAVSGINIDNLILGAKQAEKDLNTGELAQNQAYQYAVIRSNMYKNKKKIEVLAYYEPALQYFSEWWKQLFGESEGKEGKGLFPVSMGFTTDLHSLGQYMQDGERNMFETVLSVNEHQEEIIIKKEHGNIDGLNYLNGKTLNEINKNAMKGTNKAHAEGDVSVVQIEIPKLNEYYVGYLIYFFQKAVSMSSMMLEVNPFNQNGVETYKKNMFQLLKNKQ